MLLNRSHKLVLAIRYFKAMDPLTAIGLAGNVLQFVDLLASFL